MNDETTLTPPPCLPWPEVRASLAEPATVYLERHEPGLFRGAIEIDQEGRALLSAGFSLTDAQLGDFLADASQRGLAVIVRAAIIGTPPCPFPPKREFLVGLNRFRQALAARLSREVVVLTDGKLPSCD